MEKSKPFLTYLAIKKRFILHATPKKIVKKSLNVSFNKIHYSINTKKIYKNRKYKNY
jgi:hypothetical protein